MHSLGLGHVIGSQGLPLEVAHAGIGAQIVNAKQQIA